MRITIVGAGNGGLAAAADLSLRNFRVTLYEFPAFKGNIESIRKKGVIGLSTLPSTGLSGQILGRDLNQEARTLGDPGMEGLHLEEISKAL